jgi:hypothetical protein
MPPPAPLDLKISTRARAEIEHWLATSDLADPVPGLLFGGSPGAEHRWSIGMYERAQIEHLEKFTLESGHSAHFIADGVELIFWQFFLREQIDGRTLDYDAQRRFFVY